MKSPLKKWTRIVQKAQGDILTYYHIKEFKFLWGCKIWEVDHKETIDVDGKSGGPGFKQVKRVGE